MRAVESGKANIREIFDAMDTNHDGVIDRAEFRVGLEELGLIKEVSSAELDEIMAFVDADGKSFSQYRTLQNVDVRAVVCAS